MFKLHAYFVFDLAQRCMLFYGQIEPRDVGEETFTKLFGEAERLLIGESKLSTLDNEQFVLLNQEDIISGALVSTVPKEDEKRAVGLLTKLGKAFKHQYQSEIDEFDPNTCDLGTTFGGFSRTLAAMLNEFFEQKGAKPGEGQKGAPQKPGAATQQPLSPQGTGGTRFPGGTIPPEELDEILFHEYEDMTSLYNVEMVDGIVSRNKIYIYVGISDYHEITVDYSNFPAMPNISMPAALSDVLAICQTVQSWNPQNPPRIVDVVAEIEQIACSMRPAGPTQAERAADVDKYMDQLGFEASGEKTGNQALQVDEKSASNVLASRLLAKDKVGTQETGTGSDAAAADRVPMFVDQIADENHAGHKAPLRDVVSKGRVKEAAPPPVTEGSSPASTEATLPPPAAAQKPQKFVIRPRFIVDGEEVTPGKEEPEPPKPAPRKDDVPPPRIGGIEEAITVSPRPRPAGSRQEERELTVKPAMPAREADLADRGIDIAARPRQTAQLRSFAIPDVSELDSFVPAAAVKRPEIKAAQVSTPAPTTRPSQKAAPAPAAVKKPATKKKVDDEDMFGWGDGGEMEIKQSKVEIKDFDGPIKKVPDNK
ncbi:MAG: hypothetical protein JW839_06350 [Candidatus Lokiarchaeota archaeon]|nr:hypothetical protein [Candidatus Lokiarchaeota archaeon]